MNEAAITCPTQEPQLTRTLRWLGIAVLTICSLILAALTRPDIERADAATFLRLVVFVLALGMLFSSFAAFWWRDASLRRAQWAASFGLALLIVEQFATRSSSDSAQLVAYRFALLVFAVVLARMTRRPRADAAACNCG